MTRFHERQVVQLLLVRAVEEHESSFFAPEVISNAALAAIDARDDVELLEKRTAYLFLRLPKVMKGWARVALLPEDWLGSWLLVAALIGMLSNYLGPSGLVHVVYNPLAFLLVWNLVIYAVLTCRRLRSSSSTTAPAESSTQSYTVSRPPENANPQETSSSGGLRRWLLGDLYLKWLSYKAKYQGARVKLTNAGKVGAAFWESYWDAAGSVIVARLETLVHVGAIGVLLGALAGTYLRGFFFEYNAIWRSTFLTEPTSVTTFLNFLLGPASLLIDGRLLTPEAVHPLLLPGGTLAGPWIHKLALTAGLVVLAPRAILAALSARYARKEARSIQLDLSEAYYTEKISTTREGHALLHISTSQDGYSSRTRTSSKTNTSERAQPNTPPRTVADIFREMPNRFNPNGVQSIDAVIQYNLPGSGGGYWYVTIRHGTLTITQGQHSRPDTTITMKAQDFLDMSLGKLNGQWAFIRGKLKIAGNMELVAKIQDCFSAAS